MIAAVTESYPSLDLFEILLQSVTHVTETETVPSHLHCCNSVLNRVMCLNSTLK